MWESPRARSIPPPPGDIAGSLLGTPKGFFDGRGTALGPLKGLRLSYGSVALPQALKRDIP